MVTSETLPRPGAAPPLVDASPTPIAPRHVLHVINGEHYSGAERVQDLLAIGLREFGYRVGFACVKPERFPAMRLAKDAPLYELPMRSKFDHRPLLELIRIVRRDGYQLLHAHTPRTVLLAALASRATGVPLVYHVHSPAARDSSRRWANVLNASVERFSLLQASARIAVSSSLAREARRSGHPGQRVHVVPNGVPSRPPRPIPSTRREWTLGTVALFRPRKGVEILLEALAHLRDRGLPVRLLAVGPFETLEYDHQIKNLADSLDLTDAVTWTGFTANVDRDLARMDLFVLPSLFGEGMPMVVLEAMAAGVPVVATHVEGVPEMIRHGHDGLLVVPGDSNGLARAIAQVIRGAVDWRALRQNALDRHAQMFSDRSMAAGVARVYQDVLGR